MNNGAEKELKEIPEEDESTDADSEGEISFEIWVKEEDQEGWRRVRTLQDQGMEDEDIEETGN